MRILYSFILAMFLSHTGALAYVYSGLLTKTEFGEFKLRDERIGKTYVLTFSDNKVESIINRLKTDDYISFDGARSSAVASIRVDSINFVGLSDLLSIWKGNDGYCYDFRSFNELAVYPKRKSKCRKEPKFVREYAYTVNSSEGDWLVLISDHNTNYVAEVSVLNKKTLEMDLYDSSTGYILRSLKLRK